MTVDLDPTLGRIPRVLVPIELDGLWAIWRGPHRCGGATTR